MVITSITGTLRRTLKPEERDDVETWLNLDPRCVPERTLQSNVNRKVKREQVAA